MVKLRLRSPLSGTANSFTRMPKFSTCCLLTPYPCIMCTYPILSSLTSSRVYTQWHMAQSLKPSLWPLVTGIYPIPSAGSVYDDLVLFLHAFTPLITFGLICNSFRFACFVNSSLRFLIPNLHPICTCSCLFTPLTEGRSARDLTQAATSQKKTSNHQARSEIFKGNLTFL